MSFKRSKILLIPLLLISLLMSKTGNAKETAKFIPEYVLYKGQDFRAPSDGVFTPEDKYREYQVCERSVEYLESINYCHEDIDSSSFDFLSFMGGIIFGSLIGIVVSK